DLCSSVLHSDNLVHPRHSLLPYTTLFRSAHIEAVALQFIGVDAVLVDDDAGFSRKQRLEGFPFEVDEGDELMQNKDGDDGDDARSEEHTSELQSRFDLVCRFLYAYKKSPV